MKKNKFKFKKNMLKAAVLSFCVLCGSSSFAAAPGGGGGNNIAALIELINEIYNNTIKFVNDTLYALDPFITDVSMVNNNIVNTNTVVDNTSRNTAVNMIKYYLAGEEIKLSDSASFVKDSYSNVLKDTSISAIKNYNDVFNVSTDFATDITGAVPQYDINSLLTPTQYDNTQLGNAQLFIRNVETLSPEPTVIRVSNDFVVPYSPKTNQSYTRITISDKSLITKIQNDLREDKNYLSYLTNINKSVMSRAIFMQPIAEAYQNRISYNNTPSAAQLDYQEATMRLKNDQPNSYYQQMQAAPPSVVARESLFLLAEIHHDLYLIRMQNEKMLVLQALGDMQTSSFSSMFDKSTTDIISKKIFCEVYPTNTACGQTTSAGTSSTGSITSVITQALPKT